MEWNNSSPKQLTLVHAIVACAPCTKSQVTSWSTQQYRNYNKQNALEEKYRVTMDVVHGVQVIIVNDMYNIKQ